MKNVQIFNRVRNTIKRFGMLTKGDKVLLGVSGGPDSVFLTYALLYLKKEFQVEIAIAHLDHGIRGRASYDDMLFVKSMADNLKVKLFTKRIKLRKGRKHSVEESARKERLKFFSAVAGRHAFNKISTAHNADDQAETVLMRIIKGTSPKGLTGIPPLRIDGSVTFIRPIIELQKSAIITFLKRENIDYRIDQTNMENTYFRNTVRNRIIPYLSKYNPKLKRALFNLAESLREDRKFIETAKNSFLSGLEKTNTPSALHLKDLVSCPNAILKEVLRDSFISAGGNIKKLTFRHWKEIEYMIKAMPNGKALDLPGKVKVKKEKDIIWFEKWHTSRGRATIEGSRRGRQGAALMLTK